MSFFSRRIGTRLAGAFVTLLSLLLLTIGTAIWQLDRIETAKNVMVQTSYKLKLAQQWAEGIATNGVRTLARAKTTDPDEQKFYDAEMKRVSSEVNKIQKDLSGLIETQKGKDLIKTVGKRRKYYISLRDATFAMKENTGITDEFKAKVLNQLTPAMEAYVHSVQDMVVYQGFLFSNANIHIDEISINAKYIMGGIGVLALGLGAVLTIFLTKGITRPLGYAVDLAQRIAMGDLTAQIQVSSKDEIGDLLQALQTMNASLYKTVSQVRLGADTFVVASNEISEGNLDLSSRTEQQAGSLEETASSMEELTSAVRQNSDNARHANTLAKRASDIAAHGGNVVKQVVDTMSAIQESSSKIADIIGVIDSIAFQTNILALNAAVEAARAGEQGRGFAVVASEVRNLAHRSATAAREINILINDSVGNVELGNDLVMQAGTTMRDIENGISEVSNLISEIASSTAEQALGIEQVNAAITQMDGVTQQNAALVGEATISAAALKAEAVHLAQVVSTFKIKDGEKLCAPAR